MTPAESDIATALVGTWTLTAWTLSDADGERSPYGADPAGLLVYAPDGGMAAVVSERRRPLLPTPSPRRAPAEALASAYLGSFSYAGRWRVEGGEVVHAVEVAQNPALVGTEQRRTVLLDGAALALVAQESAGGATRTHTLRWRRD